MNKALIILLFTFYLQSNAQPVISENGHPEHVVVGAVIGGTVSYFVYKKTNNKLKAWFIGFATASTIGYLKEVVDPKWFNGVRSNKDFGYSVLGGAIGASIVIPLRKRKIKEKPNTKAAFN